MILMHRFLYKCSSFSPVDHTKRSSLLCMNPLAPARIPLCACITTKDLLQDSSPLGLLFAMLKHRGMFNTHMFTLSEKARHLTHKPRIRGLSLFSSFHFSWQWPIQILFNCHFIVHLRKSSVSMQLQRYNAIKGKGLFQIYHRMSPVHLHIWTDRNQDGMFIGNLSWKAKTISPLIK